jgi:hypothetical protein
LTGWASACDDEAQPDLLFPHNAVFSPLLTFRTVQLIEVDLKAVVTTDAATTVTTNPQSSAGSTSTLRRR